MISGRKKKALQRLAREVRNCRRCSLSSTRKVAVPGEGSEEADIFFIGEAPGREEDEQGRPFVGQAGRILESALTDVGLKREEVFITSILRCRPPDNRNPKAGEISACRPHLERYINTISPKVLVALGRYGLKGLTGKGGTLKEVRRKRLDYNGIPVIVTYHPAAVLRNRNLYKILVSDLRKAKQLAEDG